MGERTVADVGEFGLIAAMTAEITPPAPFGPGDDAAVIVPSAGRIVASTDVLVENGHFRRDWSTAADVGHKAAAANLADVAAMGARPTALLVGFATPADLPVQWAREMLEAMTVECEVAGAAVVGGDVVRADLIVLAITALGDLDDRDPVQRSGARPGDRLCVAGSLGFSAAGLAALQRGFRSPRVLVDAHRRPSPPYELGPAAARAGATSMIDISDGLVGDLRHVATASGVGIDIASAALHVPEILVSTAAAFTIDPLEWVLAGGEDHALAATFPRDAQIPDGFVEIGKVSAGASDVLVDGAVFIGRGGHEHFA